MTGPSLAELARVARDVACEAGALIRTRAGAPGPVSTKSASIDLVTETDRAVDRLICARLVEAFPGHGLVSEEGGDARPSLAPGDPSRPEGMSPSIHWIVDPLDGTTNFAHGFPQFAVSIAAVAGLDSRAPLAVAPGAETRTLVGVIYDPTRDELFSAVDGEPATLNDKPIGVADTARLDAALLATGFPYDRRERADFYLGFWREMMVRCRDVRRVGAAALDLAWVACGRLDGFWEWHLHAWDIAAGALIVRQAGGRVSDFRGTALGIDARQVLATNGRVHDEILTAFRPLLEPPPPAMPVAPGTGRC